jgi:hypothetical protein
MIPRDCGISKHRNSVGTYAGLSLSMPKRTGMMINTLRQTSHPSAFVAVAAAVKASGAVDGSAAAERVGDGSELVEADSPVAAGPGRAGEDTTGGVNAGAAVAVGVAANAVAVDAAEVTEAAECAAAVGDSRFAGAGSVQSFVSLSRYTVPSSDTYIAGAVATPEFARHFCRRRMLSFGPYQSPGFLEYTPFPAAMRLWRE